MSIDTDELQLLDRWWRAANIRRRDVEAIFLAGPGHGGPAAVANPGSREPTARSTPMSASTRPACVALRTAGSSEGPRTRRRVPIALSPGLLGRRESVARSGSKGCDHVVRS